MAEFVRLLGQSWINTETIVGFDADTALLVDADGERFAIPLEITCRDFQQYIDTKRHERVTYIGD